jgi:tetratricopeptide (TPR) repeat protein
MNAHIKRRLRWWGLGLGVAFVAAFVWGRALISAAYVNAAAVGLAQASTPTSCAAGLPSIPLAPAPRARAQALLERAIAWNGDNQRAWRLLGGIALGDHDLARATAALERAGNGATVQLWRTLAATQEGATSPSWRITDAEAFLLALGDCVAQDDPDAARRFYTLARDDVGSVGAYLRLGDLDTQADRLDEARRAYAYVVEHEADPGMLAAAHLGLGEVAARSDRLAEAEAHFTEAFALNATTFMASRIGLILRATRTYTQSDVWLERWADFTPASPDPYRMLGSNALDAGRPADAIERFGQAIERGGNSVQIHYGMGNAYEQLGDSDNARQAYERVLALDPDHAGTLKRLAALDDKGTQ